MGACNRPTGAGGKPPMDQPASTPYQILGEDGIRELTEAFYDIMHSLPEAASIG